MNPLFLFDHVYYRVSSLYGNVFNYQESKELNGITGLSFVQNLNLFTIINLFDPTLSDKMYVILLFIGNAVLFGLNYLIYVKGGRYKKVNSNFNSENELKLILSIILVIVYFIVSGFLIVTTGPAYS